jgi:hypothetical protein
MAARTFISTIIRTYPTKCAQNVSGLYNQSASG